METYILVTTAGAELVRRDAITTLNADFLRDVRVFPSASRVFTGFKLKQKEMGASWNPFFRAPTCGETKKDL